ncbi:MAG: ABC transporter ATP-binding protein, partial [Oxalobacteraceae bacterium]
MSMTKLTCNSLTKSYANNRVLNDVSADIAKGELVTLLGPSGCGKTTLLRAIAGLSMADTGSILLDGADITHTPIHRRNIGMVFQSHALFPHMSVTDNVAFGLRMQGIQVDERRNRVGDALALVRLSGFENRMPHELSG